jgi:ATP-dependent RNA helicase RhlE
MQFQSLNIIEPILRSLHEEGYRTPTPIQLQAIPIVLQGSDLLGVAQTGTGKTAAFAVPILQILAERQTAPGDKGHPKRRNIRCLILTPTRELAVQIDQSIKAYGRHVNLSSVVIFGGVKQGMQTTALRRGVDIVVATPGRLLDLMDQGFVHLQHVEIFVLDEADRMLDMGFVRDVQDILTTIPKKRQSLFFSATMPPAIVKLSHDILDHPIKIEVSPARATVDLIEQSVYYVEKARKPALLLQLLSNEDIKTALVFTRTKHGADSVVRTLERNRISADAIHGNKSQNARQRALDNFKAQKIRVLVATDIAARGIDVDNLEYVINYEIPNVPETYVHRIGRTGRAGASGTAISLCGPDEKSYLREIERLIKKRIPAALDHAVAKLDRMPVEQEARREPNERREQNKPRPQNARSEKWRSEHPRGEHPRSQPGGQQDRPRKEDRDPREQGEHARPRQQHPNPKRPQQQDQHSQPAAAHSPKPAPQHHQGERGQQPAKPNWPGAAPGKKKTNHGWKRKR